MSKRKPPKIAVVEWDDAHMEGWWIDGAARPPVPEIVRSVGWLVHKTAKHLVLVQSLTEGQHGNRLQIPRGMVRSIVEIPQERKCPSE